MLGRWIHIASATTPRGDNDISLSNITSHVFYRVLEMKRSCVRFEHKKLDKKLVSHRLKQEKKPKKCINSVINYADGKIINFNHLIINPLFVNWINFLACTLHDQHHSTGIRKPIFSLNSSSDSWWADPSQTGWRQHTSHCYPRGVKKKMLILNLICFRELWILHNSI